MFVKLTKCEFNFNFEPPDPLVRYGNDSCQLNRLPTFPQASMQHAKSKGSTQTQKLCIGAECGRTDYSVYAHLESFV